MSTLSQGDHPNTLLIEPFYGGSHRQLLDVLSENIHGCQVCTLPAKKWHWRSRVAALWFSQNIPVRESYRVLFASSVLNLAELVALRPDLGKLQKILYFHENQLVYPVRKAKKERDFQFGYNQILSCLVADKIVFNSKFNRDSFLQSIDTYLNVLPDYKPKGLAKQIEPKCTVLYFPLKLPVVVVEDSGLDERVSHELIKKKGVDQGILDVSHDCDSKSNFGNSPGQAGSHIELDSSSSGYGDRQEDERKKHEDGHFSRKLSEEHFKSEGSETSGTPLERRNSQIFLQRFPRVKGQPLHIVWAHRWEHDKDPELFFNTVLQLKEQGLKFELSVLGESFTDNPEIFTTAKGKLKEEIVNWGYQPCKEDYYKVLCSADVAVSTAIHEFFGVAMLEAVHCGCYPIVPSRLVYPEIFPKTYLYNTPAQLAKKTEEFLQVSPSC
ncbi:glycosyltransferase-like domain-containing protein 1 isoform X2 [Lingula anatina]|nr:glycosyltransferase-like domain-containing protein 1 isoform X2 [Lingula anatina]|eukprot:XP_023933494.1 glycosyltransferase-like domain-containing protein 1 isoform X2 [Lingula anatina]